MKLIIDIDDKRIKGIKLLAKEQDIATPYPTLEQIIANGIPLDKIELEIKAMFPPSGSWMYEEGHEVEHTVCEVLVDVLQIIDKYRGDADEVS